MKRIASTQAGFVLMSSCLCLAALGCNKHVIEDPVTVVQTRTPGVAFVIVRPYIKGSSSDVQQSRDGRGVDPESQYILMCDARRPEGMQCRIPPEAALEKHSIGRQSEQPAAPIDQGVGTLADIDVHSEYGEVDDEDEQAPEDAAEKPKSAAPAPASQPRAEEPQSEEPAPEPRSEEPVPEEEEQP